MTIDLSLAWRKLLDLAPRWVRMTLIGSVFVGEGAHLLCGAFKPFLTSRTAGVMDLEAIGTVQWLVVGMMLAFPVVWLWRLVTRANAKRGPTEQAEEWIRILKLSLDEAGLSEADRKLYWRQVFGSLANSFKVGASPPAAETLRRQLPGSSRRERSG